MQNSTKLVLVFGATGGTGYHVAQTLIAQGFAVRIVARSKGKVNQLFKDRLSSIENIVEGQLNSEQTLKQAFKPSEKLGRVQYVVSTLGSLIGSKEPSEQLEYLAQVRIIQKCKQVGVNRYVYCSALLVGRPWHPVSAILNTIIPDIYVNKVKAQNYLRKSGLNYAIVRPSTLGGDQKDTTVTNYKVSQSKQFNGNITRCTLANVITDVISSNQLPSKVTFEVTGISNSKRETGTPALGSLKPDSQVSLQGSDHKKPKYYYGAVLASLFGFGAYLLANKFIATPA